MDSRTKTIGTVIILILAGAIGWWFFNKNSTPEASTQPPVSNWLTFTDEAGFYTFRYPASLDTTYIKTQEWPPLVNLLEGKTFECPTAGVATAHAGQTERKNINGREYCATAQVEGAAGSTYTDYAYLTVANNQVIKLTFTLREPQCLNYNEPEQSKCEAEQANFDLDELVGKIVGSLEFK